MRVQLPITANPACTVGRDEICMASTAVRDKPGMAQVAGRDKSSIVHAVGRACGVIFALVVAPAFAAVLLGICCLLALPEAALAWGPGVHMVTGNWLLQNLTALPSGLASAIMSHPGLFLQGCLSADIFIGKGCVAKEGHSHNWSTGLGLLERAHTRQKLAYAAGYLSHLAADTVAHNVYVPGAFGTAPGKSVNRGKLAHVYLEIQADNSVNWDYRDALDVFRESGSRAAERMLARAMGQTAWLFWVKKHIFRGSINFGGRKGWRASMQALDSALNGRRREAELQALLTISTRAIVDLLRDPYDSVVRTLDPVGTEALADVAAGFAKPALPSLVVDLPLISAGHDFDPAESIFSLPGVLLELPPVCSLAPFDLKSAEEVAAAALTPGLGSGGAD
ncbi:zinc dependent phospholipase C family protein [Desulfovibrio sp. OttesenSCG-928-C06]|nr:zinc dependent phospholipase C family protein [Desulfovibrio sp. OttesenSCG-928-C06]